MQLLASLLYDPGTAATKATTAAAVMAVLDSTNITLSFTVPAHGKILVKMRTVLDGATTFPQVLLGIMNHSGGAVLGRVTPQASLGGTAVATTHVPLVAEFTVSGLTPGALQVDAAFGVELGIAATAIRWGGPNDTTASNAWGGFDFQIWDPAPCPPNFTLLSIDSNGRTDLIKVAGTTQTAGDIIGDTNDIQTRLPAALVSGRMDASIGAVASGVIAAASFAANALDAVWSTTTRLLTAGTNIVLAKGVGVTGFNDLSAAEVNTEADTAISDVGLTITVTGRIDAAVSSRLAAASYTAPANSDVAAIKAQTDQLAFTVANQVDANVQRVNDVLVTGSGTPADPWVP